MAAIQSLPLIYRRDAVQSSALVVGSLLKLPAKVEQVVKLQLEELEDIVLKPLLQSEGSEIETRFKELLPIFYMIDVSMSNFILSHYIATKKFEQFNKLAVDAYQEIRKRIAEGGVKIMSTKETESFLIGVDTLFEYFLSVTRLISEKREEKLNEIFGKDFLDLIGTIEAINLCVVSALMVVDDKIKPLNYDILKILAQYVDSYAPSSIMKALKLGITDGMELERRIPNELRSFPIVDIQTVVERAGTVETLHEMWTICKGKFKDLQTMEKQIEQTFFEILEKKE